MALGAALGHLTCWPRSVSAEIAVPDCLSSPQPAASWQELGEPWVPARAGPRWWFGA